MKDNRDKIFNSGEVVKHLSCSQYHQDTQSREFNPSSAQSMRVCLSLIHTVCFLWCTKYRTGGGLKKDESTATEQGVIWFKSCMGEGGSVVLHVILSYHNLRVVLSQMRIAKSWKYTWWGSVGIHHLKPHFVVWMLALCVTGRVTCVTFHSGSHLGDIPGTTLISTAWKSW